MGMKAEMYTKMFKDATDLDHPCRVSGSEYLRCVQENYKEKSKPRQMKCQPLFTSFDVCRKGLVEQQAAALESSMMKQGIADSRAKALFERRSMLMDRLSA